MKLGVIIITYNLPVEIFLLQMAAIKKFCTDDYEIELFDNSSRLKFSEEIKYHSGVLGIKYIKTFSSSQNGSDSHVFALSLSYQIVKDRYDFYLYLDHDVIPTKEFSVAKILGDDHIMAGVGQGAKKKYFWVGCFMFNANKLDRELIDMSYSHQLGLDSGGNLYKVIEKYGEENFIFFDESYHENPYYKNPQSQYRFYTMLNEDMFMHFVGGSNWINLEDNQARINSLINIAKEKTGL